MVVKDLLNKIARPAHTISGDRTVDDAINLMTNGRHYHICYNSGSGD